MKKSKISKAVAIAIASTALSAGAISTASAHTMYNTFTTGSATDTDGWTHTGGPGNGGPVQNWYGTGSDLGTASPDRPFGYVGSSHLNWAGMLHGAGVSLEVSSQDAQNRYGFAAEIDTGAGAWQDAEAQGWKHQTDVGLIKTNTTQQVHLNLETLGTVNGNFGVSVFEGMDEITGAFFNADGSVGIYSHHGNWNKPSVGNFFTNDNPFYGAGLTTLAGDPIDQLSYITHSDSVDTVNDLTFTAQAGEVYTIYLGGKGVGLWSENIDGYKLDITTSPVPVPAAVWLFGTAIAGLSITGRRKKIIA